MIQYFSGTHEEDQMKILHEMADLVSNMHFINGKGRNVKMPFQAGILVSIKSITELYNKLRVKVRHIC